MLERPLDALLLDLGDLTFLDSSGLVALIDMSDDAAARDVDLVLASVPDHALRLIERTNARGLLHILESDGDRSPDGCD
jgi:anti-anti-sigma factor